MARGGAAAGRGSRTASLACAVLVAGLLVALGVAPTAPGPATHPATAEAQGGGADRLIGGTEADQIAGGRGRDRILARDGAPDAINCGSGEDFVKADQADSTKACERVRRS